MEKKQAVRLPISVLKPLFVCRPGQGLNDPNTVIWPCFPFSESSDPEADAYTVEVLQGGEPGGVVKREVQCGDGTKTVSAYLPTTDDIDTLCRMFPGSDPFHPPWHAIQAELVVKGTIVGSLPNPGILAVLAELRAMALAPEVKQQRPPAATEADESAWVPAATLWRDRFETMKELAKFRENHTNMFRNPSPRRLKIHAGKWTAFWAARDKAGFEALDGNLQSVADDPDVQEEAIAGAIQRVAAIRAKKQAGKS